MATKSANSAPEPEKVQLRAKTSISDAPVFPPVEVTTSKRRRRPVNDTLAMRGSTRLPAGKGP